MASLGLFVLYALQWSEFQTVMAQRAAQWLSDKLGSKVTVGHVRIHWFDEIHLEDVNIKDTTGRDMIFVREVYVNAKSNLKFSREKFVEFDNNLDFVMLREPFVRLEREETGELNIDRWIANIGDKLSGENSGGGSGSFSIDEAMIERGTFEFVDPGVPRMPTNLFDYANFKIQKISGNLKNFYVHRDTVQFSGKEITGIEARSDLEIKKINTEFLYTRHKIVLDQLFAHINKSYVKDFLAFHYDKPSDLNDFNHSVRIEADLKNAELDSKDLGRFATAMYDYDERYLFSGKVSGRVDDLYLDQLNLKFGENSLLAGKMNFKGLPYVDNTMFHLELAETHVKSLDLKQYVGDDVFEKYLNKTGLLDLDGVFKGTPTHFMVDGNIVSHNLGRVTGKLSYDFEEKSEVPIYTANIESAQIDLKKLTDNTLLKQLKFAGNIRGVGNQLSNASFDLDGKVAEVYFNGYTYSNIQIDGLLRAAKFDGNIDIRDPNLDADIAGQIDFNPEQTSYNIKGKLKQARLRELGFAKDNVRLQTSFDFDFDGDKLDDWIGQAAFENTFAYTEDQNLVVDQLVFSSRQTENGRFMGLESEFFDADIQGDFVPSMLITDLLQLQKEYALFFEGTEEDRDVYYAQKRADSTAHELNARYRLDFKDPDNFFAFLLPEFYISHEAKITGEVRVQSTSQFMFYVQADTIRYAENSFFDNEIDFYSSKSWLSPEVLTSLVVQSENQRFANKVETEQIDIGAAWGEGGTIDFDGAIRQKDAENKAQLFGRITFDHTGFNIKMNPRNSLVDLLDYEWRFDPENRIIIEGQEIQFENFRISNEEQSIALSGFVSPDSTKQLFAAINHFDLRAMKALAALEIEGIADGDVSMSNYYGNTILLSNGTVTDFRYKNILVGNVSAVVDWDNAINKMKIRSKVDRLGVEIMNVNGTYDPGEEDGVRLTGKLDDADLEIFGTFVDDIFSDIQGLADGELKISGNPRDLVTRGQVAIRNGRLRIRSTGAYLYFEDTILFTEEGFVAKPGGFKVYDAPVNGHEAYLTGGIFNGGQGLYMLGLHAYMKDPEGFLLLNTNDQDNDTFYGRAYVSGDLHILGGLSDVLITANLESKRNTKISIPLDGDASIDTEKEAIPFAEKPQELSDEENEEKKESRNTGTAGLKLAFNLTFTPDAECEILIDRRNNDQLNVFGNGRLSLEYDTRDDNFTLSGPYTVTSGKYNFSFQNLASLRKFDILNGSSITWNGNPYNATLDIKAAYTANVDMSSIWSTSAGQTSADLDHTRYPVEVVLDITDQLESPTIGYDLNFDQNRIPNAHHTDLFAFEQRLRDDEQYLSKNVSFLIAFNSLYSENTAFNVQNELLFENLSSLLSNQIGNLANKLDPNLELGVSLGDFRQNVLTNMQVNVSYKFLNNRAKFSGRSSYSNGFSDQYSTYINQGQLTVGGELEYMLSADGVWRLKVHSRSVPSSNYSYTLTNSASGNVLVSGVNLFFSRNFNHLFRRDRNFPKGVGRKEEEEESEAVPMRK